MAPPTSWIDPSSSDREAKRQEIIIMHCARCKLSLLTTFNLLLNPLMLNLTQMGEKNQEIML